MILAYSSENFLSSFLTLNIYRAEGATRGDNIARGPFLLQGAKNLRVLKIRGVSISYLRLRFKSILSKFSGNRQDNIFWGKIAHVSCVEQCIHVLSGAASATFSLKFGDSGLNFLARRVIIKNSLWPIYMMPESENLSRLRHLLLMVQAYINL